MCLAHYAVRLNLCVRCRFFQAYKRGWRVSSKGDSAGGFIGVVLWLVLLVMYIIGVIAVVTDDHRYTSKSVVAAIFLPPYTWYVGIKTTYYYFSTSSSYRKAENHCLDVAQDNRVRRKARLYLCACVAEGNTINQCNAEYKKIGGE